MKQYLDLNLEEQRKVMRVAKREDMNEQDVYTFLVKYAVREYERHNIDPDERDDSVLSHEERAEATRTG